MGTELAAGRPGLAGPPGQELALGPVPGQGGGPLELGLRLGRPPQLHQQVTAHAGQQVIAAQSGLSGELVHQVQAGLGTERHRQRDGAVQLDHR